MVNEDNNIKYYYHYTSIETLALLLKYKTIRFTSLSKVDDGEEVQTRDFGDLGRFCFVSCWTNNPKESIPLWKMYTPNMDGVRIKLAENPFKEYKYKKGEFDFKEDTVTHLDIEKNYKNNENAFGLPLVNLLVQVKYTDDNNEIIPNVYSRIGTMENYSTTLDISKIGVYKRDAWEFQDEWRYRIFISPWTWKEAKEVKSIEEQIELFNRYKDYKINNSYYDVELDETKLNEMEVVLGPKTTEAQVLIVSLIVKEFNNKIKVTQSSLKINVE